MKVGELAPTKALAIFPGDENDLGDCQEYWTTNHLKYFNKHSRANLGRSRRRKHETLDTNNILMNSHVEKKVPLLPG